MMPFICEHGIYLHSKHFHAIPFSLQTIRQNLTFQEMQILGYASTVFFCCCCCFGLVSLVVIFIFVVLSAAFYREIWNISNIIIEFRDFSFTVSTEVNSFFLFLPHSFHRLTLAHRDGIWIIEFSLYASFVQHLILFGGYLPCALLRGWMEDMKKQLNWSQRYHPKRKEIEHSLKSLQTWDSTNHIEECNINGLCWIYCL